MAQEPPGWRRPDGWQLEELTSPFSKRGSEWGGRVHTLNLPQRPLPLEAIAEFLHGSAEEIQVAVRALGLRPEDVPDQHCQSTVAGIQPLSHTILWSPRSVDIVTNHDKVYTAQAVILTLPLGVLQIPPTSRRSGLLSARVGGKAWPKWVTSPVFAKY